MEHDFYGMQKNIKTGRMTKDRNEGICRNKIY